MKRVERFFHSTIPSLSILLSALLLCTVLSCSNLVSSENSSGNASSSGNNAKGFYTISGTFSQTLQGAFPSEVIASQDLKNNSAKSTLPTVSVSDYYYEICAYEKGSSTLLKTGTVDKAASTYSIVLGNGEFDLKLNVYKTQSGGVNSDLVLSGTTTISVSDGTVSSGTLAISLAPVIDSSKTGTVNLLFYAAPKIAKVEACWNDGTDKKTTYTYTIGTNHTGTFNMVNDGETETNVKCGSYAVTFKFYYTTGLAYSFVENVTVYENLETSTWVNSTNAPYFTESSGTVTLNVSETLLTNSARKTFFVDQTNGDDDDNNGGYFDPYKSIDKALTVIKSLNSGSTDAYEIQLLSDVVADASSVSDTVNASGTSRSLGNTFVQINSSSDLNLTISSASGNTYAIDANGSVTSARGIFVGEYVNLTLKNIKVTGGKLSTYSGAGVYSIKNSTLTLDSGSVIDSNTNTGTSSGSGVACFGQFYMNSGAVISNNGDSSVSITGGGLYLATTSTYVITGGTFDTNKANKGGALYMAGYASGTVSNSVFKDNLCTITGGAVWAGAAGTNDMSFTDCTFTGNQGRAGGAIYFYKDGTVSNCTFTGNKAVKDASNVGGWGGAICTCGYITTISGANIFTNNEARIGGAIYCQNAVKALSCGIDLSGGTFTGNALNDDAGKGNAIYISAASTATDETSSIKTYLNLYGSTVLASDQIIYLEYSSGSGDQAQKYISLGDLTGTASEQKFVLSLGDYTTGTAILKEKVSGGTAVASFYDRFSISDSSYAIDSSGLLVSSRSGAALNSGAGSKGASSSIPTYATVTDTVTSLYGTYGTTPPVSGQVYTISSATEMGYLGDIVSAGTDLSGVIFVIDSNNLSISSMIGDSSNAFNGILDGKGNTVNLNIQAASGVGGFIYSLGSGAIVRNLEIAGAVTGQGNTGIIAETSGGCIIENIHSTASVTNNSSSGSVGGIVGKVSGTASDTVYILNCINQGSVTASTANQAGGIIGSDATALSGVYIENCANLGTVSAKNFAAGIAGVAYTNCTIYNCYNMGNVSLTQSGDKLGAITAYSSPTVSNVYYLNGCGPTVAVYGKTDSEITNCTTFTGTTLAATVLTKTSLTDVMNAWITLSAYGNDSTYSTYKEWGTNTYNGYPIF